MLNKKHVDDYRLENVKDKKGRTVTKAVYAEKYYTFVIPDEELKTVRRTFLIFGILFTAMFITAIAFYRNVGFSSQYYTLIPFAACAFPLFYYWCAIYEIMRFKEKCTGIEKDHMKDRIAKCTFVMMILSGWNLCGILLAFILTLTGTETRPVTYYYIVYIISSALFFSFVLCAFSKRKKLDMREV